MHSPHISRRSLALSLAVLPVGLVNAVETPAAPPKDVADGLSYTSEAIRQEVTLDASPQRVYQALTSTKEFDSITRLSDGAALLNASGAKPTAISTEVGFEHRGFPDGNGVSLARGWYSHYWEPLAKYLAQA